MDGRAKRLRLTVHIGRGKEGRTSGEGILRQDQMTFYEIENLEPVLIVHKIKCR